jgi:hypothetical protein
MEILNKKCVFCGDEKPIIDFIKNKECSLGVNNKCKQCMKEYRSKYNIKNKSKILEYNIEYNKEYNKKWGNNNKHIIKWRSVLYRYLVYTGKKKNGKTEVILGYSIQTFKSHIEQHFTKGMNWDNIHIDHKIPITWFKNNTPIQLVNSLHNLQPQYSSDNISKLNRYSDKITKNYFILIEDWILPQYVGKIKVIIT